MNKLGKRLADFYDEKSPTLTHQDALVANNLAKILKESGDEHDRLLKRLQEVQS